MQHSTSNSSQSHDDPSLQAREVASHIWKVTVPIPFPLRTVNLHIISTAEGWVLVDAGMGTPEARPIFAAALQQLGLSTDTLRAIVLTHHHPDHIGLSGELQQASGAPVYMHPIDEQSIQSFYSGTMPDRFSTVSRFFLQHGLPSTQLWLANVDRRAARQLISVPPHDSFILVEDGQQITLLNESYRVFWTPGHSDGHICLLRESDGVFLAGDHVLQRITPNIGLYSERDRQNPLGDYLASLEKVSHLPASIVLPGHGEPFIDLAGRTIEIAQHHQDRIEQILSLLANHPQNARQLADQLFHNRLKNDEARRMAVAEVLSHLEYMRLKGLTEQHYTKDDIILYAAIQAYK